MTLWNSESGPFDRDPNNPDAPPAPAPPPAPPGPSGPAPVNVTGAFGTWTPPHTPGATVAPADYGPTYNFGPVPKFTAPQFHMPSFQDAMNDPGYQFRSAQGQAGIERSAAAKGLLRTGGTLKDISQYNQDYAAQEYQNVFNRDLSAFDRQYAGARDEYSPLLAQWSMLSNAELQRALAQYGRGTSLMLHNTGGYGGPGDPLLSWQQFSGGA